MKILYETGGGDPAKVYVAELDDASRIEFVESIQPPISREEKWVLIVSTLKGCPVKCPICDAGGNYGGKLTIDEIFGQLDFMILGRFPDGRVPVPKLKIQFARMGDPAFNDAVVEALRQLPVRYEAPGIMPCISTIGPAGHKDFFDDLISIKNELYSGGRFQTQFSVHTTDEANRRRLIPANIMDFSEIGEFGRRYFQAGDRKITLNFAAPRGFRLNAEDLTPFFPPDKFLVKLTPINPTSSAARSGLTGLIDPADPEACDEIVRRFVSEGYETILSIGDLKENEIGSNCGMYVTTGERRRSDSRLAGYTY